MKTSRSKAPANQTTLPGMEQALCACGCNMYFMRVSRGRKRLYLNATHKKRVARRKAQARQTETPVRLTARGKALAEQLSDKDYTRLWDILTPDEQWVVHLSTRHPGGAQGFWSAVALIQERRNAFAEYLHDELGAEYEDN